MIKYVVALGMFLLGGCLALPLTVEGLSPVIILLALPIVTIVTLISFLYNMFEKQDNKVDKLFGISYFSGGVFSILFF